MTRYISKRLASLAYLARPLALAFVGIVLLSLGVAYLLIALYREAALPQVFYYLTLQFIQARWVRGAILMAVGLAVLAGAVWRLSGLLVIPLNPRSGTTDELLLGYQRLQTAPRVTVLSGGAGILVLANIGRAARRLTCITPLQDPVEYYYRAASLSDMENVIYVVPTPAQVQVLVALSDGSQHNIKHVPHNERLATSHVADMRLAGGDGAPPPPLEVTRQTTEAIGEADVLILGPGSLFESIIPNLLIPQVREAVARSKALKIYICNLMTEPGLTTGFSVADHVRQICRFGGFTPDYVLVNAQRIEPEIRQIYAAANQVPVFLNPEEYEETIVYASDRPGARDVVVEGAVVIEADLASSVIQSTASLERPGEVRAVRVLRHDPDKLTAAVLEILRRA